MNIFYVDRDPLKAAQALVDKHVVKMVLESAQILSTAHRVADGVQYFDIGSGKKVKKWLLEDDRENRLYKATHVSHPSVKWVMKSVENYQWLADHFNGLLEEYTFRYGKTHKCGETGFVYLLNSPPFGIKDWDFTAPPSVMPPQFQLTDDPAVNYRLYYKYGKRDLHKWTKRPQPEWI